MIDEGETPRRVRKGETCIGVAGGWAR